MRERERAPAADAGDADASTVSEAVMTSVYAPYYGETPRCKSQLSQSRKEKKRNKYRDV